MDEQKEFRMMGMKASDGSLFSCYLVFEKEIPHAVWATCPENERWIPLDKNFLQETNAFMGGEFIHYFYQLPIRMGD